MAVKPTKKAPPINKPSKAPITDKLEDLSAKDPMPFEGGKGFSYINESEYLPFLTGQDNNEDSLGTLLLQSRLLSCTHNACVTTKKDYCAGTGFQTRDEKDISNKKFNDWIASLNLQNESETEINKQIFESLFTFGNVPIEVIRYTINGKKQLFVYVQNFLEWRLGKPDPIDGISKYAIHSRLFLRNEYSFSPEDYEKAKKLPIYNPRNKDKSSSKYRPGYNWVIDENGVERTIIWYKHSIAGFKNYGLPSSISSLIYQILEYKGARFNLDNLINGAVVSAIIALKGNLSDKELDKIGKRVVQNHTGEGKRGRVMVVGSEEGISGSDFHSFETHKEGSFKESDEAWTQKIILANQWDAILAGIIHASTMGKGVGFLTKILETKKNSVIIPAQLDLIDNVWRHIISIANDWLGLGMDVKDIQIKNSIDISGLTDVDITPAVTVNEVREAKGLVEDTSEKGKMYLGELGANQKKGVYVKDTSNKKQKNVQQE